MRNILIHSLYSFLIMMFLILIISLWVDLQLPLATSNWPNWVKYILLLVSFGLIKILIVKQLKYENFKI